MIIKMIQKVILNIFKIKITIKLQDLKIFDIFIIFLSTRMIIKLLKFTINHKIYKILKKM